MVSPDSSRERYFVVGTGRSGSSFLCSILSEAGARFGLSHQEEWDRSSGAYELEELQRAGRWYTRQKKLADSVLPGLFIYGYCRKKMRSWLSRGLEKATFAKTSRLVWLAQQAHQLEYNLNIIVVYRRFASYARSRYLRHGRSFQRLRDRYENVNSTALLELHTFGGCAISYEEITSVEETQWARALAELTGFDAESLLEARENHRRERRFDDLPPIEDERTRDVYQRLRKYEGRVVPSQYDGAP